MSGPAAAPDRPAGWADVAVIGASAGGVGVLQELVTRLPADLGLALLIVLHVPATGISVLRDILARRTVLAVARAEDGFPLARGVAVVAPTDHHMLVDGNVVRLSHGPLVNGHRPAVDPTLETAARTFGPRTLGVLLSGTLDDGAVGLAAVRTAGGRTAVQDPQEAPYPGMPLAAIEAGWSTTCCPPTGSPSCSRWQAPGTTAPWRRSRIASACCWTRTSRRAWCRRSRAPTAAVRCGSGSATGS